jgi:hypothetical protein
MNRDHASPDDAGRRANDAVDGPQLTELEQRLKCARPRPPELDVDVIMRLATEEHELAGFVARPPGQRLGSYSYRVGAIAGSWLFGAVVGSLVTFILLGRSASQEDSYDSIATANNDVSPAASAVEKDMSKNGAKSGRRGDVQQSVPLRSPPEVFFPTMLLDPCDWRAAPYGVSRPILRVGNSVRYPSAPGSWRVRFSTSLSPPNWPVASAPVNDTQRENTPRSAPAPAITREQLLRELLEANPDFFL